MTAKERNFNIGTVVRHFKGKLYRIEGFAEHTETGESLVIYRQLYAPYKAYARPEKMFCSLTDKKKYPNARQEYRMKIWDEKEHVEKVNY